MIESDSLKTLQKKKKKNVVIVEVEYMQTGLLSKILYTRKEYIVFQKSSIMLLYNREAKFGENPIKWSEMNASLEFFMKSNSVYTD